jgi:hypothetical protein
LTENVAKILAKVPQKAIKALVDNAEINENKRGLDKNNNLDYFDESCSSHSSDSSYFETQELFEKDFLELMMPSLKKQDEVIGFNSEPQDMWFNKEYDYPKLVWDQTNSLLTLKVNLENVKDFKLDYRETSISFR